MSRPSQNLDLKLLAAGKALIEEQGLGGFTLRAVAKKAGVNLGMFHYHFKGKDDFVHKVLQASYEEFFESFSMETGNGATPLESLRRGLVRLAVFMRDHRSLVLAMLSDAAHGRPEPRAFAKKNVLRHGRVIVGLVRECQKQGLLVKCSLPEAMPLLMGATAFPSLVFCVLEKSSGKRFFGLPLLVLKQGFLSDKAIENRVRYTLLGLMVHPQDIKDE